MPRNGSGGYSPPQNSWNPAINGMGALPNDWMAILNDMSAAIEASIAADGQTPITGIQNFGGNRIRNVGAPQGQGDALRFEQLGKGPDIQSAATISFPIEGSLFDVTGTSEITGIAASNPGRMVLVRFLDELTLTSGPNLVLPGGVNITAVAGDISAWVCLDGEKWQCWVYPRASESAAQWLGTPVGGYITPHIAPPTNDSRFRYVFCTAGQTGAGGYNEGVLIDESVSGSSPLLEATAKVSLAGSPFDGLTIHLINTEERFIGAATSEGFENDTLQRISGTFVARTSSVDPEPFGLFQRALYSSGNYLGVQADLNAYQYTFDTQGVVRSGAKTQPRAHRLVHYRRIK